MPGTGSLIGQQVGPYFLEGLLGAGGMGEVYRAQDLRLGRPVAMKIISASKSSEPRFAARFQREARVLAQLDHPNILPLWDVGQVGDLLYLVTPVVEGGSLRDLRLRMGGKLLPEQAISLAIQVADALQHAHERGVIHRDVKPGNLLLRPDGRVLLADFGIARSVNDRPDASAGELAVGTPNYVSPEQAVGDQVDARADVYSLGAVLYELLAGRPPYQAESTTRVLVQMMEGPPLALRALNPSLSSAVQTVVMRALASQPDARYPTAAALATDLRKLLALGVLTSGLPPVAPSLPGNAAPPTPHLTIAPPGSQYIAQPTAALQRAAAPARTGLVTPPTPPSAHPPASGQPRPIWTPVAPEPPRSSRSTYLALFMTLLVIAFLGVVFTLALVLNR